MSKEKENLHDTYVLGLDNENKIIFFKTYNYSESEQEAQEDLQKIIDQKLTWEIGDLKRKLQDLLTINKKWNDLDAQISMYYQEDEDGETELEYNLAEIGENAASAFGYMKI